MAIETGPTVPTAFFNACSSPLGKTSTQLEIVAPMVLLENLQTFSSWKRNFSVNQNHISHFHSIGRTAISKQYTNKRGYVINLVKKFQIRKHSYRCQVRVRSFRINAAIFYDVIKCVVHKTTFATEISFWFAAVH